jgi:putative endonuclease
VEIVTTSRLTQRQLTTHSGCSRDAKWITLFRSSPRRRGSRGLTLFYTYLLASDRNGTLYCGHTDDIAGRVWKHKEKVFPGFTAKYAVQRLVWFEVHDTREAAFRREQQIKKWNRSWKLRLIEEQNPQWLDLYETLNQ